MNTESQNLPRALRSRVQEITIHTDSRDILAAAVKDQKQFGMKDYFIVDVDSHHVETDSWDEVIAHIDDPVLRYNGQSIAANWPIARKLALHNEVPGLMFQDCQGRIPHQATLAEAVEETDVHRDVTLIRRGMESIGFDLQVVFPQPMLEIGLHPNPEIAAQLVLAYNRWFVKDILPKDSRMRSLLALPFEDPDACLKTIREHADNPSVLGFMITSQRHTGVHRNEYIPIYRELEERGLPVAFHAGPTQSDTMTSTMNRFLSVHAMSFVTCNMTHMTNWIINGLPERFPKLEVMWVESGLAWLPFMMQRLDTEYLKRQSDAPMLKRLPSGQKGGGRYDSTWAIGVQPSDFIHRSVFARVFGGSLSFSSRTTGSWRSCLA
jgi:predicted TIM-barrel fold metal-dependent hydrolase